MSTSKTFTVIARDRDRLAKIIVDADVRSFFRKIRTMPRVSNGSVYVGSKSLRHLVAGPFSGNLRHINGNYLDCRRENIRPVALYPSEKRRIPGVVYVPDKELRCIPEGNYHGCWLLPSKFLPEARKVALLWPHRNPSCRACGQVIDDEYALRFFYAVEPDGTRRKAYLHQRECTKPGEEAVGSVDRDGFYAWQLRNVANDKEDSVEEKDDDDWREL